MTQLDRIMVARGGKRPETADEWNQYEADKAARRANNVVNAKEVLDRNEVAYIQLTVRPEVLLRIALSTGECVHYYPERGLWYSGNKGEQHFGVRNLVRHIKGAIK
jgi:hypothetical protein